MEAAAGFVLRSNVDKQLERLYAQSCISGRFLEAERKAEYQFPVGFLVFVVFVPGPISSIISFSRTLQAGTLRMTRAANCSRHQQICSPMLTCKQGRTMPPTKFPYQRLIPEDELRRTLSPETLGSLKTLDDFARAIWPAIVKLFEPRRGSSYTPIPLDRDVAVALEVLILRLDAVAIEALRRMDFDRLVRESQPALQQYRTLVTEECLRLEQMSKELATSASRLGGAAEALRWGATTFDSEIRAIDKKRKVLAQFEAHLSLLIDPTLRDDHEARLAATSRYSAKASRNRLSLRKNSADLSRRIIEIIESEVLAVLKILKVKAVSSRIEAFVKEFFDVALNGGITEENVRTLRIRMRQEHKVTPPRSLTA
jgi:hypothetical protein